MAGILDAGYRLLDPVLPFDKYLDPRFGGGSGVPAPQAPQPAPVRSGLYGPEMGGEPPRPSQMAQQPVQMFGQGLGFGAGPQAPTPAPEPRRKPTLADAIWGVLAGHSPGMARLRAEDAYATAEARDIARRAAAEEDAMARRVFGADEAGYLAWRGNREKTGEALASRLEDYTVGPGGRRGRGSQVLMEAPTAPLKLSPGEVAFDPTGRQIASAPFRPEVINLSPGSSAAIVDPNALAPGSDDLFERLIIQESGGRPGITGPQTPYGRAQGMTQMLPATAEAMAKKLGLPWRPEMMTATSPEAAQYQRTLGRAYFDEGLEKYGGDPEKALMYYHGGPDEGLWGPKTRSYAQAILGGGNRPASRVVARGDAKPMARPATAEEKAAYGLSADTPATMMPDGELKVLTAAAKDLAADEKAAVAKEMQAAKAQSIIATIDGVLPKIGKATAGLGGQWLGAVPGTEAYDVGRQIETIKANLGFQELQAMRESSPTGGALGAIAVQELIALQATVASLDQGQSPKQLEANLKKIRTHYNRWLQAVNGQGGAAPSAKPTRPAQKDPFPGIKEGQRVTQNGVTYRRQGNQMVPVR